VARFAEFMAALSIEYGVLPILQSATSSESESCRLSCSEGLEFWFRIRIELPLAWPENDSGDREQAANHQHGVCGIGVNDSNTAKRHSNQEDA
jgi:hypothetical protein